VFCGAARCRVVSGPCVGPCVVRYSNGVDSARDVRCIYLSVLVRVPAALVGNEMRKGYIRTRELRKGPNGVEAWCYRGLDLGL
jgi:hypothetical protein